MVEDWDGQMFQVRFEWSEEAISEGHHTWAYKSRRTPIGLGVFVDKGRLWTPAASMSFGACAWSNGNDCVKGVACKAINSNRVFIMYK